MLKRAFLALALVASPAFADPPEEELTAAPGSIAYGMIEEANADGVFDIVHNGQVSVRHLASGMRCDFARDGEGGQIILFAGLPRGDNVACRTVDTRESFTLFATRYPDGRDLDEALAAAEAAVLERFPNAQLQAATDTPSAADLPARRVRHFTAVLNGRRALTSVALAQANGWTYMVRYAAVVEREDLREHETAASALMTSLLLELEDAR
jgi:hypothetical protein